MILKSFKIISNPSLTTPLSSEEKKEKDAKGLEQ